MTKKEASEAGYDICIYYDHEDNGWKWDVNGGYSSVGGRKAYTNILVAQKELNDFLKTFKGFEK